MFPSGHPTLLNYCDRTRTGIFNVVWPVGSELHYWNKLLKFILLIQRASLHFHGIWNTYFMYSSWTKQFFLEGTKDFCLGVKKSDLLAHVSPHLICRQDMHLDSSLWTSNYAVIIFINSIEKGPSWETKICSPNQRGSQSMQSEVSLSLWN